MSALQSQRTQAYSSDLRWRMVYQRCLLGLACNEIARNLNVDKSTVSRVVNLFEETGIVCPIQGYREFAAKKLTTQDEIYVITALVENPPTYLHELSSMLLQSTGKDISTASIHRLLQKCGFSYKKLALRAQQRSGELRQKFMEEMTIYSPEMLVFVDETGTDKRSCLRKYGYAMKGRPAISEKLLVRGKRFSAISSMSMSGILDLAITTQSVDGEAFISFVERNLLPHLLPFNGVNEKSVVILDNASIHHVPEIESLIEETGAIAIYLPPYSPDLNPIEECFSKIKNILRANDPLIQISSDSEIEMLILASFASITPNDCEHWMEHCGYMYESL